MPLLGKAAIAMWWTVDPALRIEFGDWHSHEHFPERLGISGFLRGSRWMSETDGGGFFVLYELEAYDTLISPRYLERLNHPTPWSTKMMPHHLGMVRSQCRVVASHGGGVAGSIATIRLSPADGASAELEQGLGALIAGLPDQPGLTAAHLLRTQTPAAQARTTEQQIRGGDKTADWILIVSGYDRAAVTAAVTGRLGSAALQACGVGPQPMIDDFRLSFTMTHDDVAVRYRI